MPVPKPPTFQFNAVEPWHIPCPWAKPYDVRDKHHPITRREEMARRWLVSCRRDPTEADVRSLMPFVGISRIDSIQAIVSDLFVRSGASITHSKIERFRRMDAEGLDTIRRGRGERVFALDHGSRERLTRTLGAFQGIGQPPKVTTLAAHMGWGKTSTRGALLIISDSEPDLTSGIDIDDD